MGRTTGLPQTLRRHWSLLAKVPRAPERIDAGSLERFLTDEGHTVHRRSVQRDLEALSETFVGLSCDDQSKPYGWYWSEEAPLLEAPPMGFRAAATLELLRTQIPHTLPGVAQAALAEYFAAARRTLRARPGAKMARWAAKFRYLPVVSLLRSSRQPSPELDTAVLDALYQALLEERRLTVRYRTEPGQPAALEISPLGLLQQGATLLLVYVADRGEPEALAGDRIESAELLDRPARRPKGFDLERFARSLNGEVGPDTKLRAAVSAVLAARLLERPLADDQVLKPSDKQGWELLQATVADSPSLRSWILSCGTSIEVLGPAALRRTLAAQIRSAARLYE